jgi:Na+-translocating ferredoxin:NAD+ oxidoreductase RNF subunit RnfB
LGAETVAILYPVLFLGLLGLAFGIMVSLASKKLSVFSDHTIQKISDVLPNVNCGVCGHASCSAFAKAVVEGKKDATGCIPGGAKTAHAIGDIMGVGVTLHEPLMAVVKCKGGSRESTLRCTYDGIHDCHAAILAGNGPKTCFDGCLGLGSCVKACPFGALRITDNNVAVVDPDACTGCGACVTSCPRSVIDLIPLVHKIYLSCSNHDRGARVKKYCSVGCTSCTLCVKATPSGAIAMANNLPVLDYKAQENFVVAAYTCPSNCFVDLVKFRPKVNIDAKCDGCTLCVSACPTTAISGEKGHRHVVNKEKCIGCGLCMNRCPVHAIAMWGGLGYVEGNKSKRMRT